MLGDRVSISTSRRSFERPIPLSKPCVLERSEAPQAPPVSNIEDCPEQRASIDWIAVEHDYRAGQQSLRELGLKHGCSHSAIANRASRHQWPREWPRGHDAARDDGAA